MEDQSPPTSFTKPHEEGMNLGYELKPSEHGRKSYVVLAWIVILGICGFKIYDVVKLSLGIGSTPVQVNEKVISINDELMGKLVIGGAQLSPESTSTFTSQIAVLKEGAPESRLAYAILIAEVQGAEEGQIVYDDDAIMTLDSEPERWSENETRLHALLGEVLTDRLAGQPDLPSLDEDERQEIEKLAGWLGAILLNPAEGSDLTQREELLKSLKIIPIVMGLVVALMGVFCIGGLIGLIFLLIRAKDGLTVHGFQFQGTAGGGIYLETFAVWISFFLGIQYLIAFVGSFPWFPANLALPLSLVGFFVSLLALSWPVLRGVSWKQVRRDIGWTSGQGVIKESLMCGVGGYALVLPIAGVGFLFVLGLMQLQNYLLPDAPAPSHPAQGMASSGDLWVILQLYILACVAAPIVEETMFRGVLYRYFRDKSRGWNLTMSFLFSALASSFLFAAIHPQGLATIPALMGLAIGFCLIREWRGSLLAAMVAHGLSNFLVISLNVVLFGS